MQSKSSQRSPDDVMAAFCSFSPSVKHILSFNDLNRNELRKGSNVGTISKSTKEEAGYIFDQPRGLGNPFFSEYCDSD